jgi:hypothetical protein
MKLATTTSFNCGCHARFKVPHSIEQCVAACPELRRGITHLYGNNVIRLFEVIFKSNQRSDLYLIILKGFRNGSLFFLKPNQDVKIFFFQF